MLSDEMPKQIFFSFELYILYGLGIVFCICIDPWLSAIRQTQPAFTCSKLTIETLEQVVKYVEKLTIETLEQGVKYVQDLP